MATITTMRVMSSVVDVTGDLLAECIERHDLTVETIVPADEEGDRATLAYASTDGRRRMTCRPVWYASMGSTYSLTIDVDRVDD